MTSASDSKKYESSANSEKNNSLKRLKVLTNLFVSLYLKTFSKCLYLYHSILHCIMIYYAFIYTYTTYIIHNSREFEVFRKSLQLQIRISNYLESNPYIYIYIFMIPWYPYFKVFILHSHLARAADFCVRMLQVVNGRTDGCD